MCACTRYSLQCISVFLTDLAFMLIWQTLYIWLWISPTTVFWIHFLYLQLTFLGGCSKCIEKASKNRVHNLLGSGGVVQLNLIKSSLLCLLFICQLADKFKIQWKHAKLYWGLSSQDHVACGERRKETHGGTYYNRPTAPFRSFILLYNIYPPWLYCRTIWNSIPYRDHLPFFLIFRFVTQNLIWYSSIKSDRGYI